MKFKIILFLFFLTGFFYFKNQNLKTETGAPPYGEPLENAPVLGSYSWLSNWSRPEGPPKVALQVGHWKNEDFPEELKKLRGNTGSTGRGLAEWQVNYEVARHTAKLLREFNIQVEILPATVPPSYWSDAFIAIHADGSTSPEKSGYKIARPWRDFTGNADLLVSNLSVSYEQATSLPFDDNISKNMRGYYAFSWWRYTHSIHPMTTAAIVETGFLSNASDQKILIDNPEIAANGLASGIINYLKQIGLIS